MTEQWSDRSAMLNHKTLRPSGPLSYLHGSALKTWSSYWTREGSAGMDTWNAPTVQSRQPLTYRLMESVGLGGPRWFGSSWQRGVAESGSSQLSTLMTEIPGDLVWDLSCVQQASCLKGGPLLWIWPLYLHFNKKSDDDDDDDDDYTSNYTEHANSLRADVKVMPISRYFPEPQQNILVAAVRGASISRVRQIFFYHQWVLLCWNGSLKCNNCRPISATAFSDIWYGSSVFPIVKFMEKQVLLDNLLFLLVL